MKVIDYSLIESDSHEEIVQEVTRVCREEGWVPSGGICVWLDQTDLNWVPHYAQALVKYGS